MVFKRFLLFYILSASGHLIASESELAIENPSGVAESRVAREYGAIINSDKIKEAMGKYDSRECLLDKIDEHFIKSVKLYDNEDEVKRLYYLYGLNDKRLTNDVFLVSTKDFCNEKEENIREPIWILKRFENGYEVIDATFIYSDDF